MSVQAAAKNVRASKTSKSRRLLPPCKLCVVSQYASHSVRAAREAQQRSRHRILAKFRVKSQQSEVGYCTDQRFNYFVN